MSYALWGKEWRRIKICMFVTRDRFSLHNHVKFVHEKRMNWKCDLCPDDLRPFSSRDDDYHHLQNFFSREQCDQMIRLCFQYLAI